MTQFDKILALFDDQEWVCTSQMYALFIADPRRRICDLKDKGYVFAEPRICQSHDYHDGGSKEWKLISEPIKKEATTEVAPQVPPPPSHQLALMETPSSKPFFHEAF